MPALVPMGGQVAWAAPCGADYGRLGRPVTWKLLPWLILPLMGLVELAGHFYVSRRAPDLDAWRALRPLVAELARSEALIVVAPEWAEPNARHAFGDRLMPFAHVARADVTPFGRAVEVSILGARASELAGWREISRTDQGAFRLRVLENPSPAKVVFDFVDAVADARVWDEGAGGVQPCPFNPRARRAAGGLHGHPAYPAERHQCGGGDWHFVGVTAIEDEKWRGRRCIWAHPQGNGVLVAAFDDVPLGGVIRGYGGLPWWTERGGKGGPVHLEVQVDGQRIGRFEHEDGDGFAPFEFSTGRGPGQRGSVEFRISAPRPRHRQFCFTADTR
jgi:hypothetical protein